MQIRFGYEIVYQCPQPTPMILNLHAHYSRASDLLVPDHLREASYALGTRKARTITSVVLPSAAPGVVSGCLLAIARAAGETAPLLFTIGAAKTFNWNVFSGPNSALSYQIFQNAFSSKLPAQERGWGAAFTLVAIAFLFTIIARVVTSRYQKRRG